MKVTIHDVARGGSGVARLESGEIVFVPYTAPGDEATIKITEKNKNYSQGELVELLTPSPSRTEPLCPAFQKCGGCAWQHLPYSQQFEIKKNGVLHALKRAGIDASNIAIDELPAASPYFYRNRIQLRGNPKEQTLGFYERNSTRIIAIEDCKIARKELNDALPQIREEGSKKDSEYKVELEVLPNGEIRAAWNMKHAAFGFRQVNDEQNLELQKWVQNQVETGEHLLDLFGGAGNLSLGLISKFKKIDCVDIGSPKERPSDLPPHFQFHRSATASWLEKAPTTRAKFTQVILDPPREGLGSDFLKIESNLNKKFNPERIVLVGCDPDSFARDAFRFTQKGYHLVKLGVLDLFPQTPHVESLAVLKRTTLR
jgi:tRNA/tmRNA/rRNA uracil-C5-methylase (TrmA/RlmC/RlmD family)